LMKFRKVPSGWAPACPDEGRVCPWTAIRRGGLRLLSKVLRPADLAGEDKRDGEYRHQPSAFLAHPPWRIHVWGLLSGPPALPAAGRRRPAGSPLLPPVQIRGEKLRKPCAP
jgi:hypothetical protein